jgi:hypothetical protein
MWLRHAVIQHVCLLREWSVSLVARPKSKMTGPSGWELLNVPWRSEGVSRKDRRPRLAPAFVASEIKECIHYLDEDSAFFDEAYFKLQLDKYEFTRTLPVLLLGAYFPAIFPIGLFVSLCLAAYAVVRLVNPAASFGPNDLDTPLIVGQAILMVVGYTMFVLIGNWGLQFYGYIAKIMKTADRFPSSQREAIKCVNIAGKAAQRLFRELQGGRRTWASPPAVADRALAIAYPIINVSLNDAESLRDLEGVIDIYVNFLYYAAGLVAVDRHDLVPALREYYAEHHSLSFRVDSDSIPDRDVLFLDPMRNHHRWAVAKDFLFPLAAWLSLVVSVVALVVNIGD